MIESRLRYVACFVLLYLGGGIIAAITLQNFEFAFYAATIAPQIALLVFMDRRVRFSSFVLWGMALWGLLHFAGGLTPIPASLTEPDLAPVLYNMRRFPWFPKYDQMVHAYGFGMTVFLCYEAICARVERELPVDIVLGSVLFLCAMGLGAVNEVLEFVAVLLIPDTNVGGYINTGWDLVSNGTGALIAVMGLSCFKRPPA